MARSQRRTAFFYDAPLSTAEDVALLKAMLLFFDDVAVFSTPEHRSRPPMIDPHLCAPLAERGLLHFVDPRVVMTHQADVIIRSRLHRAAVENSERWLSAAAAGDWDTDVPRLQGRLSGPLAIGTGQPSAAANAGSFDLFKYLAQDGVLLPDESTDDEWLVTPGTASVVNSILAQAVRCVAREQGQLIEPVATRRDEARVFTAILDDTIENVSASDVVMSDLSPVTVNLTGVGLDDILDFRARHRSELRAYVLALQALVTSGPTGPDLPDRRAALAETAKRLLELQGRRWTKVAATVSLGIVGSTWTLGSGDLLGALIGGAAGGARLLPGGRTPVSAYTYILRPDPDPSG